MQNPLTDHPTDLHDAARQARRARAWGLGTALLSACACVLAFAQAGPAGGWAWVLLPVALAGPLGLALLARQLARQQGAMAAELRHRQVQQRRALLGLLDTLPLALALVDRHENRAQPNQAMAALLHLESSGTQRPSFDWQRFLGPDDAAEWAATRDAVMAEGSARWLRCSLQVDGAQHAALMLLVPWAGEQGRELAVHLTLADGDSGPAQEALLQLRELLAMAEAEKWQFGQAVHDELGQRLSGMAYFSKALQRKLQEAARAEADDAGWLTSLANESMAVSRGLARGLLPVGTEDPRELATALAELCDRSGKTFGIDCALQVDPGFDAGGAARASHLYRAIQELLTNAVKHGGARRVQVQLEVLADGQRVTVRNDGRSLAGASLRSGLGLRGVRSRAAYLGASFSLADQAAGAVLATIELPKAAAAAPGPTPAQNGDPP